MCRVLSGLVLFTLMTFTMTHLFMGSGDGQLHGDLSTATRDRLGSFRSKMVGTAAHMWRSGGRGAGDTDEGAPEERGEASGASGGGGGVAAATDDRVLRLHELAGAAPPPPPPPPHVPAVVHSQQQQQRPQQSTTTRRATAPEPDSEPPSKRGSELERQTEAEPQVAASAPAPAQASDAAAKAVGGSGDGKMNVLFLCADDFRAQTMVRASLYRHLHLPSTLSTPTTKTGRDPRSSRPATIRSTATLRLLYLQARRRNHNLQNDVVRTANTSL